ncbi:MAG TPA: carboxypeptidase-like regulatory domain-containing protein [Gemmataceae bacterium]|nr:carboxypeptidase-like regulatory domain-containing protein [Gemmataceae bacterium]
MRYFFLALISLSFIVVGCGKKSETVKVSGRVTMDDRPLSNAQVHFQLLGSDGKPDPSKESAGQTDGEGRYSLTRVLDKTDGAVPGNYRVEIHAIERSRTGIRELIPSQYNKQSKLTFTVPSGGATDANFDLKSK